MDAVCVAQMAPGEILEPAVAVEPAPVLADLGEPSPDLLGWRIDRDRPRRLETGPRDDVIPGQRFASFAAGRTPALAPRPKHGRVSEKPCDPGECPPPTRLVTRRIRDDARDAHKHEHDQRGWTARHHREGADRFERSAAAGCDAVP